MKRTHEMVGGTGSHSLTMRIRREAVIERGVHPLRGAIGVVPREHMLSSLFRDVGFFVFRTGSERGFFMKTILIQALHAAVMELAEEAGIGRGFEPVIILQHPARAEHGDYSTNLAMTGAKAFRKPPMEIAAALAVKLQASELLKGRIERIGTAAPGFINFHICWPEWVMQPVSPAAHSYAGSKVLIEHTSINPNKSAHIGHLRNSCIGDTLARLMKKAGAKVEVHNYIDDLGNQLADTLVGMQHIRLEKEHARFGDFCWDIYAGINKAYKENPELQERRSTVLHELEAGVTNTAWLGLTAAERIVREHVEEMAGFGIGYDVLVWESSIVRGGFWDAAFHLLQQTPSFVLEKEGKLAGCWILKQTEESGGVSASVGEQASAAGNGPVDRNDFQTDKVLVRSNGILTYTAKDIAYHLWKFGLLGKDFTYRKFADGLWSTQTGGNGTRKPIGKAGMVINVIDHRQEYPQAMVKQALSALGYCEQASRLRHVGYGVVSLSPATASGLGIDISDGKASYPMSGRQGIGIKISELLDRMEGIIEAKRSRKAGLSSRSIAAASIRYYLLRFHLQTEVVFDLEQATEISGNTGVYLLYAYARTCSVLKKAERQGFEPSASRWAGTLPEEQETLLMRHLSYWPEALEQAAAELSPQTVCSYAHELCSVFNHFYAVCPVLKSEGPVREFRLWLTKRTRETLHEALDILGLPAPSRM
jgi:arginyl-tRNA synthetase